MGNEAASPLVKELTTSPYTYKTVETLDDVVLAAKRILLSGFEQVALVTIRLFYKENEEKVALHRLTNADYSAGHLLTNLRTLVRKTDSVLLLGHTLYFLLPGANLQGGQIVQNRLWERLLWRVHNLSDRDVLPPQGIAIGHSAYPMPYATLHDFIEAANNACLHFDSQPEKSAHKPLIGQAQQAEDEMEEEELSVLARKMGIPYLTFLPRKLPQGVQRLLNPKLAQELHCYPLGRERNKLTVAMLNPQDRSALDRLKQETGLHIFPVLTHPHALQIALEQLV